MFAVMLAVFASLPLINSDGAKGENRETAKMPALSEDSLISGEFMRGFESFIDDNIGFRSFLTSVNKFLGSKKGIITPAGRLVYADSDIGTDEIKKSKFLIVNDSVFELFFKDRELENSYADAVNHYAKNLDSNINLYCALIPTAIEFQEPMYANTQDSQKEAIDYIAERLDSRVKMVDIHSSIQKHSDEYVYFRTDHHWTQLGAYYGYAALCEAAGLAPVDKNAFQKSEMPEFFGSLYKQASAAELAQKPDTIEWYNTSEGIDIFMRRYDEGIAQDYKSPIYNEEYSNSYSFFLSGDNPLVCLTNKNNPDGKTLVIIRDSFSNVFAPWIIQNYHRVVLVDPRSCKADFCEIIDAFRPDDALIMNYVPAVAFEDYSSLLTDLYRAP